MSNVNREDVGAFLKEGREYFEEVEPLLIQLLDGDDSVDSKDTVATAFRIFHSVKGVSGFLSFNSIQGVTHKVEEVLDSVRSDKLKLTDEILSVVFDTLDFIKQLFDLVDQTNSDAGQEAKAEEFKSRLMNFISSNGSGSKIDLSHVESLLLPCFHAPGFFSEFKDEFDTLIQELETGIFSLLDKPQEASMIFAASNEILKKISFNSRLFGFIYPSSICGDLEGFFNKCNELQSNVSDVIGPLFKVISLLKDNSFNTEPKEEIDKEIDEGFEELSNLFAKAETTNQLEGPTEETIAEIAPKQESSSKVLNNAQQEIRVDLTKIDKLVELIEELGVVTGVVATDPESSDFDIHVFNQGKNKLTQITSNLQDVAMSVRLVPLSATFKKMNRLVFDVSSKLNKKVKLEITGENTEIDKNMVEAIQDPLVHIFRNAIDHGIELPEERELVEKPELGTVQLKAWHSGGEVHLSIQDDGKGIDSTYIKNKAIEKGILTEGEAAVLPDNESNNLVMAPGFSTAQVVTDFSGRGVGMDVVKQSIEKLNGRIHIDSQLGVGTTFLLSFPLTSTIVEGMLVKVGALRYTIRIASIRESFKTSNDKIIIAPDGQERVHLRDQIFPVFRLSQLNKTTGFVKDIEEGILVLVDAKEGSFALFVDDIIGTNQSVIKTLPKYFGRLKGVAGCSVIGTGSADISWTVDINSLMN